MAAKYIFTADDFGPIDFINKGVYYAVHKGLINSVQVLANGDKGKLVQSLAKLNDLVQEGQTLDLGLHLTLTSGSPLYKNPNQNAMETWGKMLKNRKFKKYSKFYFGYDRKFEVINNEFKAQLERLQESMVKAKTNRLALTSLSHHHGIFAIDDRFFGDYYVKFGNDNNLIIRNPKALPASANNSFFGFVLPLFNTTDRKEDRKEMEVMNAAFGEYKFASHKKLEFKTPTYTEVGFYNSFGSLGQLNILNKRRIEKRVQSFDDILNRANKKHKIHGIQVDEPVVELVLHIGNPMQKSRGFRQEVKYYSGVSHKYFENRQHEILALERVLNEKPELKKNQVSWTACEAIAFQPLK